MMAEGFIGMPKSKGHHAGNKLSDKTVRAAKEPGLYSDGHGLYLQVSSFNTKAWVFRFQLEGRARKMGIGPLHTVSLAEARKRAAAARLKVLDRIDPVEEKHAGRNQKKVEKARAVTFGKCAADYIASHRAVWSAKHTAQWFSTFHETRRHKRVYPAATKAINDLPVAAIDTPLVLTVIKPIWTETPETANRVRNRIETVLDFAKAQDLRGGENPARWKGHLDQILPARRKVAPVEHHAAVPYADLPAFLVAVREQKKVAAKALEFCALTATRTGETLGARWPEIDLAKKLWTIPGSRMKAGKDHRVPLADRALAIISDLPRDGDLVFPGRRGERLGESALRRFAKRCGAAATVHGLRSAFRDWAAEQTHYPSEIAEMALAHAVGDSVERAYRRTDMMERRRRLMADWAAYCEQPLGARDNVVSIGAGRA
jgi:integrase